MPERKRWLNPAEWYKFEELFWDVEGTSYYDVRELALDIAAEKNPEPLTHSLIHSIVYYTILYLGGEAS